MSSENAIEALSGRVFSGSLENLVLLFTSGEVSPGSKGVPESETVFVFGDPHAPLPVAFIDSCRKKFKRQEEIRWNVSPVDVLECRREQANVYLKRAETRLRMVEEIKVCIDNQRLALVSASRFLKNPIELIKDYWKREKEYSIGLLDRFDTVIQDLRGVTIHPSLNKREESLLDFCNVDLLKRKRREKYKQIEEFDKKLGFFVREISRLNTVEEITQDLIDISYLRSDRDRILEIYNDFASDLAVENEIYASRNFTDYVASKTEHYISQERKLEGMEHDSMNELAKYIDVHMKLMTHVLESGHPVRLRDTLNAFRETIANFRRNLKDFELLSRLKDSYPTALEEVVLRKKFYAEYTALIRNAMDKWELVRDKELQRRRRFMAEYGKFIPSSLLNLKARPPKHDVSVRSLEEDIIKIDLEETPEMQEKVNELINSIHLESDDQDHVRVRELEAQIQELETRHKEEISYAQSQVDSLTSRNIELEQNNNRIRELYTQSSQQLDALIRNETLKGQLGSKFTLKNPVLRDKVICIRKKDGIFFPLLAPGELPLIIDEATTNTLLEVSAALPISRRFIVCEVVSKKKRMSLDRNEISAFVLGLEIVKE